jgi:hypothetical protein
MSQQYKTGIAVGILVGVGVYFLLITWVLPVMSKLTWVYT